MPYWLPGWHFICKLGASRNWNLLAHFASGFQILFPALQWFVQQTLLCLFNCWFYWDQSLYIQGVWSGWSSLHLWESCWHWDFCPEGHCEYILFIVVNSIWNWSLKSLFWELQIILVSMLPMNSETSHIVAGGGVLRYIYIVIYGCLGSQSSSLLVRKEQCYVVSEKLTYVSTQLLK